MSEPARQWSATPKQLLTIVLVVIGLFFVVGVVGRVLDLYTLKQQQAAQEALRRDLLQKIENTNSEIEYLKSDGYVEIEARRNLLWGLPGEKLIITRDTSKTPGLWRFRPASAD